MTATKTMHFVVRATGADPEDDAKYDALYNAGCDDVYISTRGDQFSLAFRCDAASFEDAVAKACAAVVAAGAVVVRIEPDNEMGPGGTPAEIAEANARHVRGAA